MRKMIVASALALALMGCAGARAHGSMKPVGAKAYCESQKKVSGQFGRNYHGPNRPRKKNHFD